MTNKQPRTSLSKSLFLKGLQCPKALYLHKYNPELRDEIPASLEAVFQLGTEVGEYAQKLFPGGTVIPYGELSIQEQIKKTEDEIKKGKKTIYEASFSYDDVFVKVDILHKGRHEWEIHEVKSSASVKDVHIDDTALQYYVLSGTGLPVSNAFLVHLNGEYVKNGDIEPRKLFVMKDITDDVKEKTDFIRSNINSLKTMLTGDMPEADIGEHCATPYGCDFKGYCWRHIPEDSIFSVTGKFSKRFDLYRQGVVHMKDIPQKFLSGRQRIQVNGTLKKKDFVNPVAVKEFLDSLWYPLYFLDFETILPAIPLFDGTRPYQQIPFQYSLHYLENETDELKHTEYLANPMTDFRKELLEKLLGGIPDNACVLVYNSSFEIQVLKYLAEQFPGFKEKIETIIDNVADLAIPFRRMDLYRWQMNGSHSLKIVLPALVPELSYEGLEIREGSIAMDAYAAMCRTKDKSELDKIRKALLEYCKMDTIAMVRIVEKMREVI
ncbi:MAG: DUF2779 domain-containing protein [Nitrospirae bacterium]|nr:DUF2779 domain-containing protein [Nitrospirota bacterium]